MPDCRRSTWSLQSQWRTISGTAIRHATRSASLRMRLEMYLGRGHLWRISMWLDCWPLSTFQKRNGRRWIAESLPAYSFCRAYWLTNTMYMIDWRWHFAAPEMKYSEKGSSTQHQMLWTKRACTTTSTDMLSRNRNPHPSWRHLKPHSQPEMDIQNRKRRSRWTTNHLQCNWRTHEYWLALRRQLVKHGRRWAKVVAATLPLEGYFEE